MTLDSSSGLDVPFHVLVFQSGLLFNITNSVFTIYFANCEVPNLSHALAYLGVAGSQDLPGF